jgi:hypothetical protein
MYSAARGRVFRGRGKVSILLPSYIWYQGMADLNEAITDEQAGDRLLRAIQGKGAFRRFKDELRDEYPDLLSARQVFRDARAQRAARPSHEQKKRAVAWEASCPGLVCVVTHDGGLAHVQALHGLAGDLSDEVEVLINVQNRQPSEFSSRSDDQTGCRRSAMLAPVCEQRQDLHSPVLDGGGLVLHRHGRPA